jgi:hypothetical protein
MIRRALLAAITILAPLLACADTLKADADLRPFADRVMAGVASTGIAAGISAGIAVMRPYVAMPEVELQKALLTLQSQREAYPERFGKTVGYEFIGQRKLGESLVRLAYIEKTERRALPWLFHFYKTRAGWVLESFMCNDQASQLFIMH